MKQYYTLLTYQDGTWAPQFGDYSRKVVYQEQEDSYTSERCKIISTPARQKAINEVIAKLNA